MLKHLLVLFLLLTPQVAAAQVDRADRVASGSLIEDLKSGLGIAEGAPPRALLPIALDLIKEFEGWEPAAYDDPSNYCTIGYGHLIALKPCAEINLGQFAGELSLEAGAALLEKDTVTARLAIREEVRVDLSDHQFGALTSFIFNVGKGNFKKSTLLALVNERNFDAAAEQFPRWVKSAGVILPGLVERRSCEQALFRGTLEYTSDGNFRRSSCNAMGITPGSERLIDIVSGE